MSGQRDVKVQQALNLIRKHYGAIVKQRERLKTSPAVMKEIRNAIRTRISSSIRSSLKRNGTNKKGHSWEQLVGFTLEELVEHLESQFTGLMTWENMGRGGWHIDHIIPVSYFNFTSYDDEEFKICWSLNNLQPLWEHDNISKGAKLVDGWEDILEELKETV